jgi:hypothetical protein
MTDASHPDPNNPTEKHIHAYDRMLERVRAFMDEAEGEFGPKIQYAIESAKEKASELGELSREEAEKIGDYLQRDLKDAADYLTSEGAELADWLRFDVELVEDRFAELLNQVVDTTKIELQQLAERAKQENIWTTGEITGPGTLTCINCGHKMSIHHTHEIPACPKCQGTMFQRRDGN